MKDESRSDLDLAKVIDSEPVRALAVLSQSGHSSGAANLTLEDFQIVVI